MSTPSVPADGDIQPAVRVMRLYKPPLRSNPNVNAFQSPNFNVGEYLTLPDNFGEIYYGETFTAYVGVVNDFNNIVFGDINIRVRLQSSTAAHDLADTRGAYDTDNDSNNTSLKAQSRKDMIISHRLLELGAYTMRVTIGYTDTSQQTKTIRKFYRFNVECPLKITTSCVYHRESRLLTLSGEVRNMTKNHIFLDKMSFSSQQGNLINLHAITSNGNTNNNNNKNNEQTKTQIDGEVSLSSSTMQGILSSGEIDADNFDMAPILAPNEQYSLLFLEDNLDETQLPTVVDSDHPLGTVDIVWRACMGEESWFSHTVSSITGGNNHNSSKPFVNILCLLHSYEVEVMQLVDVTVRIEGLEQSQLAITFELLDSNTTGLTLLGTTKHSLILPNGNETYEQSFQLLATCPGLHSLCYNVKDVGSGRTQSSNLLNILCL